MSGPISQNGGFYSNDASSSKKSWLQLSVKSVKRFGYKNRLCILQLSVPYCVSLIMVTITSRIFINIFQTVHFPAVKFPRGNKKNRSFLLIPKSPKVWEKFEVIGPGSFNGIQLACLMHIAICIIFIKYSEAVRVGKKSVFVKQVQ